MKIRRMLGVAMIAVVAGTSAGAAHAVVKDTGVVKGCAEKAYDEIKGGGDPVSAAFHLKDRA